MVCISEIPYTQDSSDTELCSACLMLWGISSHGATMEACINLNPNPEKGLIPTVLALISEASPTPCHFPHLPLWLFWSGFFLLPLLVPHLPLPNSLLKLGF